MVSDVRAGQAPINLNYLARGDQMPDLSPEDRRLYSGGTLAASANLFYASEGLGRAFRGAVDYPNQEQALRLPNLQFVTFAQIVG
jgi:hypothetical protein